MNLLNLPNLLNIIEILSASKYSNWIIKKILNSKQELYTENWFIIRLFKNYCLLSNLEMIKYICEKNHYFNSIDMDNLFFSQIFKKMCKISNYSTINWYLNKFENEINLSDTDFIIQSIANPEQKIFKLILNKSKNYYMPKHYEKIFLHCAMIFNIKFMRWIFEEYTQLDLMILNNLNMYNSLNVYSPIYMFHWLKSISINTGYLVEINENAKLIVSKTIIIEPIDELNKKKFFNLQTTECILCLDSFTNIITNCGHKFCSQCIELWIKKNHSCPICRLEIPKIKFHLLTN